MTAMRRYCTAFDSDHLFRGLALYHSLVRHSPGSVLWVLCLDPGVEKVLGKLAPPDLNPVPLRELEVAEPTLRGARQTHTRTEFNRVCIPAFLWHLLARIPGSAPITHLDTDVYFFSSPDPVLVESSTGSIALLPYRYPPQLQRHQRYGTYRPSWITFLDDRVGREALAWWRNRCIEWCHDRMEMGRFGSQKYLDDWPERFQDVHVLRHEGAGVAPWNVAAHPISRGPDGLHAGGAPLVFYDFRGFKRIASWLFDPNVARYRAELTPALRDEVYRPYVGELRVIERQVRRGVGGVPPGWGRAKGPGLGGLMVRSLRGQLLTIS